MRRLRRPGRLLLALAALLLAGRLLLHARAVDAASATRDRLAARYGDGCVAVLPNESQAGRLRCRVGGVEVGIATASMEGRIPEVGVQGLCLDPARPAAGFSLDLYAADGRFLGPAGPVVFFPDGARLGETRVSGVLTPGAARPPLVVALRAVRSEAAALGERFVRVAAVDPRHAVSACDALARIGIPAHADGSVVWSVRVPAPRRLPRP